MKAFALAAIAALAVVAPPPPRSATNTATVALVADLPADGARAAIIRQAQPRVDVILLARSRASVEDLAAALSLLAEARARDGNSVERDAVLVVKSSQLSQPLTLRHRLRLGAHLARLRATPPRLVDGVGSVPAIDVNVRARPQPR